MKPWPSLWGRGIILGVVLTGVQAALPSKTVCVSGKVLETRRGFPLIWMVVNKRDSVPRYDIRPLRVIPDFLLVTALATFILWGMERIRANQRRRRGHCRKCGYDLTGNVSGVCPECGGAT